jgi:hypothetical protein
VVHLRPFPAPADTAQGKVNVQVLTMRIRKLS